MPKIYEDLILSMGGAVKALDDKGKIGGVLVRFTDAKHRDLDGEYFTDKTYLGAKDGQGAECTVHHGMPLGKGQEAEDLADHWLAPLHTSRLDVGIAAETILDLADEYESMLFDLVKAGKLGWSSGTAGHLVKVTNDGEITRWPIIEGSLTPTPAEPKNMIATLKSMRDLWAGGADSQDKTDGEKGDPDHEDDKPKKATKKHTTGGVRMSKLVMFPIGGKFYVYLVDAEGERAADPLEAFDKAEDAQAFIADEATPDWLKAMKQFQEAADQRLVKILEGVSGGAGQRPMVDTLRAPQHTAAAQVIDPVTRQAYQAEPWQALTEKRLGGEYSLHDFVMAVARHDESALFKMGAGRKDFDDPKAGSVMDPGSGQVTKDTKVLGDQTGIEGGFLVPASFIPDLIRIDPESEVIWPRCRRWPMQTNSVTWPSLSMAGSTPGQTNTTGGVHAHWTETGTTKHEDEPEFGQLEIVAHELSVYTEVKNALIQGSPLSVTAIIQTLFGEALRFERDEACLDGTGVGMPFGIIDSPGTLVLTRDTANHVLYEDLVHLMAHLLPRSYGFSFWVCNVLLWEELTKIQDPAGNYIWQPNAREGINHPLLGRPIVWTEKTPVLGTKGDIMLVDPRYYYGGDKQDVMLGSSEHFRFRSNRMAFRASLRVGGREAIEAPIYLKDGVNQVSPFVELDDGAATT